MTTMTTKKTTSSVVRKWRLFRQQIKTASDAVIAHATTKKIHTIAARPAHIPVPTETATNAIVSAPDGPVQRQHLVLVHALSVLPLLRVHTLILPKTCRLASTEEAILWLNAVMIRLQTELRTCSAAKAPLEDF